MTVPAPRAVAGARIGFPPWAQTVTGVVLLAALFEIVPQLAFASVSRSAQVYERIIERRARESGLVKSPRQP